MFTLKNATEILQKRIDNNEISPSLVKFLLGDLDFSGNWELYYCLQVEMLRWKSKDKSSKCGCIITTSDNRRISDGYNGPVRKSDDELELYHTRPHKYSYFEHAERNALYNAAYLGHSCAGATLYVTGWPCADCARGIIQSGIKKIIIWDLFKPEARERWKESFETTKHIFSISIGDYSVRYADAFKEDIKFEFPNLYKYSTDEWVTSQLTENK